MALSDQITAPVREFARIAGIGESTAWEMVRSGTVQTINIGKRRLVVLDSYRRFIDAQLAEPPKDARRNGTVPSLGSGKKEQPAATDLALPVNELKLSTRATNALLNDGIRTVGKLIEKTEADLLLTPSLGRVSLAEIQSVLHRHGLHLGMELPAKPSSPASSTKQRR